MKFELGAVERPFSCLDREIQACRSVCMSVVSAARDDTAGASNQPAAGFGERENLLDRGTARDRAELA
ncbi:hypothetical protein [Burkholderia ambifaria]|uniref:hypothetical protein n=1 Tax=Burkholderia ambifaria TaxID=152480 RepID=UPI00158CFCD7|nr:hypothetical protein [Burkholderia ambifaria]